MNFAFDIAKRHALQPAGYGPGTLAPSLHAKRDEAIHHD